MAPAITGVYMKPMPIAGTETMFCKDIIDATETSEPSVTARSECNYSGVCKSEQEGKKLIETGEKRKKSLHIGICTYRE